MGTHILSNFGDVLDSIRAEVITMASIAQHNLEHAVEGLLARDRSKCNETIAEDDDVDSSEKSIDAKGHEIILRFSPVAHDLRQILSAMKIATNLERISDEAVNIARRSRMVLKQAELPVVHEIEPLYEMAIGQLRDSIKSFAKGDVELALTLGPRDKELDAAHDRVSNDIVAAMERPGSSIKTLLHLLFIIRSLERIGDHAVNIAEDAVFMERAHDIRHTDHEEIRAKLG